jgi:hypothetical protein
LFWTCCVSWLARCRGGRCADEVVQAEQAVDYVMIDPTWVGGIAETVRLRTRRRLAAMTTDHYPMMRYLLPLLLLGTGPAHADVVGLFDGLGPMSARSDAVLLVRIDQHVETPSLVRGLLPNTGSDWYVEDCFVLKTFKGHLKQGELVRLRLFKSGPASDAGGFGIATHHLVFLSRVPGTATVLYQGLKYENSSIQVSPNADTRKLTGKTLKESLRLLVPEYQRYRQEKAKREDAFFTQLLK